MFLDIHSCSSSDFSCLIRFSAAILSENFLHIDAASSMAALHSAEIRFSWAFSNWLSFIRDASVVLSAPERRSASRLAFDSAILSFHCLIFSSHPAFTASAFRIAALNSGFSSASFIEVPMPFILASSCLKYPDGSVRSSTGGTKYGSMLRPPASPENPARNPIPPAESLMTSTPSIFPSEKACMSRSEEEMCPSTAFAASAVTVEGVYLNGLLNLSGSGMSLSPASNL